MYAAEDEALREELVAHLSSMIGSGLVQVVGPRAAGRAEIIVLLLSAYLLRRDVHFTGALGRVMARHQAGTAWLVPVLVRPVDLDGSPLQRLAALPALGRPVKSWADRDRAWQQVIGGLRTVLARVPR